MIRLEYLTKAAGHADYAAEGAGPLPNHSNRKELSKTVSYM